MTDLCPSHKAVLDTVRRLVRDGKPASAHRVARELGVSHQYAGKVLALLEKRGLVRDQPKVVRSGNWVLT